jgi:hypothetical protein
MVCRNTAPDDEFKIQLASDLMRLRKIAGLNIQRASRIAYDGDEHVAEMLLNEAGVMLTVVVNVEKLLGVE